jgi:hypothetical protein
VGFSVGEGRADANRMECVQDEEFRRGTLQRRPCLLCRNKVTLQTSRAIFYSSDLLCLQQIFRNDQKIDNVNNKPF